jgi:hypothetical protein
VIPERLFLLLCCLAGLSLPALADDPMEEEFGQVPDTDYIKDPEWQEQRITLPPYPSVDDLVEVDMMLTRFPFSVWIDTRSLAIGEDRVLRYTVVLRSESGAENVIHEGIRCSLGQVKRYAYGRNGEFRPVQGVDWRFIRRQGQDRYRAALREDYFCPLPGRNRVEQLVQRLKTGNPKRDFYSDE